MYFTSLIGDQSLNASDLNIYVRFCIDFYVICVGHFAVKFHRLFRFFSVAYTNILAHFQPIFHFYTPWKY